MGWFGRGATVLGPGASAQNLRNLEDFTRQLNLTDGEFSSDLEVMQDGHHKFVIVRAKRGGPVVAYALLRQVGPDAELEQLFSAVRRSGHGALAVRTAEAVARKDGASVLWLKSVPDSVDFYRRMGFATSDGVHFARRL